MNIALFHLFFCVLETYVVFFVGFGCSNFVLMLSWFNTHGNLRARSILMLLANIRRMDSPSDFLESVTSKIAYVEIHLRFETMLRTLDACFIVRGQFVVRK